MRFFLLLAIATFTFALSNCNRAPASASTPNADRAVKNQAEEQQKNENFNKVENYVEEAIKRIEDRVEITDEQKESIRKIGMEYDFAGADMVGRREYVKKMMDRVKAEVLTEEQRKKASNRN